MVHGGDLALGGWQPAEVVDRVRELGWPGIVGNTDEVLWRPEELEVQVARAPRLEPLLRLIFLEHAPATCELLGEERIEWLRELPAEHRSDSFALVHAAPGDLWRAPMPNADEATFAAAYGSLEAPLVVYGHIHRPFVRELSAFTVANSGSVGAPYDGDPRASYLLIDDGRAEVVRVEYDVEREVAGLLRSGYPDAERVAETRRRGEYVALSA